MDAVVESCARRRGGPRTARAGLTLIEVMIVVTIVAVLVAVAVPIIIAYVRDSKKSEPRENLRIIAEGALTYYQEEHTLNATVVTRIFPIGAVCTEGGADMEGGRSSPDATDWSHPLWDAVRFSIAKPHYYRYCYQSSADGRTFTAWADAALGGDGAIDSRFCVAGREGPVVVGPVEWEPGADCASLGAP